MSFLSAGEREARAGTIRFNARTARAARAIHSNFEKKFFQSEVVGWQTRVDHHGYHGQREIGLLKLEGKDHTVKDGDLLLIRHG